MGRQCLYYDSQWLAWEPKPNGLSTLALANGVRWRKRAIKMAIALSAVPSNTWLLCVAARNSYKWTDDKDQMSNVYVCVYWWLVFSMIFSRAQQKKKSWLPRRGRTQPTTKRLSNIERTSCCKRKREPNAESNIETRVIFCGYLLRLLFFVASFLSITITRVTRIQLNMYNSVVGRFYSALRECDGICFISGSRFVDNKSSMDFIDESFHTICATIPNICTKSAHNRAYRTYEHWALLSLHPFQKLRFLFSPNSSYSSGWWLSSYIIVYVV